MTDEDIADSFRAFEACALPRSEWTHERHLIMALCYLLEYPSGEATESIRRGIQRYNRSHGNHTGYHETITLAWIAVIERFLRDHDRGAPRSQLAADLIAYCGRKDYLLRFYSKDVLFSPEARERWVPPDHAPIA
jgi:hypothetical protein